MRIEIGQSEIVAEHLAISAHPQDTIKDEGESHAFTVATSGGIPPLSYTWRKDGIVISGATSATYNLGLLRPEDTGTYSVTVSDSYTDVVFSNSAILTVNNTAAFLPLDKAVLLLIAFSVLVVFIGLSRRRARS